MSKETVSAVAHKDWKKPLGEYPYDEEPDLEARKFYKQVTGIKDDEELKQHILAVRQEAFELFPYPCIRVFEFMRLKLARLPAYGQFLELGKRDDAIFIDLGCCFGNDCRKAVVDGWPVDKVVASDKEEQFWPLGHKLFKSDKKSFPVPFVPGNIFDDGFLAETEPATTVPSTPPPKLTELEEIGSFNPLRGHVTAVFTGAFFHLFSKDEQTLVAQKLAGLLSPKPGSMLIGVQGGRSEEGFYEPNGVDSKSGKGYKMYCHSPQSWKKMWENIFGKDNVDVPLPRLRKEVGGPTFFETFPGNTNQYHVMEWSVTRK